MFKLMHKKTSKALWLVEPQITIGSGAGSDFTLPTLGVKPKHCTIYNFNGELSIENIDGAVVYVNNQLLHSKASLALGDIIRLSNHEFVLFDPAAESLARRQAVSPLALTVEKQLISTRSLAKKATKAKQQVTTDKQAASVTEEERSGQQSQFAILLVVTTAILFVLLILWFLLL